MTVTITINSSQSLFGLLDALKEAPSDISVKLDKNAEKELKNRAYIESLIEAKEQAKNGQGRAFESVEAFEKHLQELL